MALYPCDATAHRYVGAQQTMYPALANGIEAERRKLRLCPIHFEEKLQRLERTAHDALVDFTEATVAACVNCTQPVSDSTMAFFCTVYARGADRADWWGPVHEACAEPMRREWGLPARIA